MTAMQPVVVNPKIGFAQLAQNSPPSRTPQPPRWRATSFSPSCSARSATCRRRDCQGFRSHGGHGATGSHQKLKALPLADVTNWFIRHPGLGELLDRQSGGTPRTMYVSDHPDRFERTERGYGKAHKPEDYLREFGDYLKSHGNEIPALLTVLTRPRDLTRAQLRELVLALDTAGFTETRLATAWRELTNQDIAARIVGYIRQAAIGDPCCPTASGSTARCSTCWLIRPAACPGAHRNGTGSSASQPKPGPTCW
jgi:type I restriction enzyme R subunit